MQVQNAKNVKRRKKKRSKEGRDGDDLNFTDIAKSTTIEKSGDKVAYIK
jgi:hypothetical protein